MVQAKYKIAEDTHFKNISDSMNYFNRWFRESIC